MAKYRVTLTEYTTTTYEVEAEDEEDAFEAAHWGEHAEVISKETADADEFGPPDDTATLVPEEEDDSECGDNPLSTLAHMELDEYEARRSQQPTPPNYRPERGETFSVIDDANSGEEANQS